MIQQLKELGRLADEQAVGGQGLHSSHSGAPGVRRADNRTPGEFPAQKRAGFGHDQASFEYVSTKWRFVKVGKHQIRIGGMGQRRRIAHSPSRITDAYVSSTCPVLPS